MVDANATTDACQQYESIISSIYKDAKHKEKQGIGEPCLSLRLI
jgi:hypothetical protein